MKHSKECDFNEDLIVLSDGRRFSLRERLRLRLSRGKTLFSLSSSVAELIMSEKALVQP